MILDESAKKLVLTGTNLPSEVTVECLRLISTNKAGPEDTNLSPSEKIATLSYTGTEQVHITRG